MGCKLFAILKGLSLFEALLEELRHRGEGVDLDYKAERYRFVEATDVEKSEMLKDILALANTDREGSAYIVLGFKENKPNPAKVVGIATSEEVDDAHIQQFVNSKLGRKLKFSYQEVLHQGKLIGLVTIPRQKRPFYVNKKFGKVQADTVYIRRGTSTSVASLEEIADMGLEDVSRAPAQFTLSFLNGSYELLDSNIECTFVRFPAGLDDFPLRDGMVPGFSSRFSENPEYWRKAAEYISLVQKAIPIRFALTNRSAYSISEVCVELVCCDPSGKSVSLRPEGEMPNMPEKSTFDTVLASELVFPVTASTSGALVAR
ncbi:AlbA family DNA-binding domain-containing protein [Nitratireductor sp. CH_MIT9313-5]|uniref:AlbA family DNA-binding domain-containing protein n=1 Tax=Nitratireductor sp. CH_MIT9313-5 TaxID=3107764 RepID=UPI00300BD961